MRHLPHLDGCRALAALYVLFFHALFPPGGVKAPWFAWQERWIPNGQVAVVVFIVLSGYCLMLPAAAAEPEALRGGIAGFYKRRFGRIFPAYAVSLAVGLLFSFAYFKLRGNANLQHDLAEDFSLREIFLHLTMLYIFDEHSAFRINGVFWSIAVEWWIYALFAFLLLPLWRRTHPAVVVVAAIALGLVPYWTLPAAKNFYWARPWYLGAFALGMAATLHASSRPTLRALHERIPWGGLAGAGALALVVAHATGWLRAAAAPDLLVAFTAAATLGWLTTPKAERARQWLSSPFLRGIGASAYSNYLFHPYVLKAWVAVGMMAGLAPALIIPANLLVFAPLSTWLAHLLARWLEAPFVSRRAPAATSS